MLTEQRGRYWSVSGTQEPALHSSVETEACRSQQSEIRETMRECRRLGFVVLAVVVGLAGCGGDNGGSAGSAFTTTGGAVDSSVTTTTGAVPLAQTALPSGAGVSYPSEWTSYGVGFAGSLELAIPGVANISVRDTAASEYLYGPMLPEQESLEGAFAMFEFGMGDATIGATSVTAIDGREILTADVVNDGKAGLMAITESGDSYASVYAEALATSLPLETIEAILQVLASISP